MSLILGARSVPSVSDTVTTSCPIPVRYSVRYSICVVFPQPSIPSNEINNGLIGIAHLLFIFVL